MSPRVPPLPRERWDGAVEAAIRAGMPEAVADKFISTGADAMRLPNAIATMVANPQLAGPFLAYNHVMLREPTLDARLRELMVMRVAWRTRSEYEWVQHARLAPRYAITPAEIEAIASGDGTTWTPLEASLLAATDQLLEGFQIDDATWKVMAAELDEASLVEAVFVVGTYSCLAMVFNGLGVELDPELDRTIAPLIPVTTE